MLMVREGLFILVANVVLASASLGQDLCEAVRSGDVELVKSLLESGVDVNTSYENGFTAIYFAEEPRIIDLLVSHGARLDIRDEALGQTPIERAAEKHIDDPEHRDKWRVVVETLRRAGAEYTVDTAIYLNDIMFIKEQLAKDDSWVNDPKGAQTVPLRLAARAGRTEICRLLLQHGADPDSFDEGTGFPILVDAMSHPAIVRLLIEHGADLKTRITWHGGRTGIWIIGDDATALHYAASDGTPETINLLINRGVDIFATAHTLDDNEQSALEVAAFFGRADNARAILNHPKFDNSDRRLRKELLDKSLLVGAYPSWLAKKADRPALLKALLNNGADPNALRAGFTAMQIAAGEIRPDHEVENREIKKEVAILREHGATVDLFSAVAIGDEEQVGKLVRQGPDSANSRGPDGYPALLFAVKMNYGIIVKQLIATGCDVDIRNNSDVEGQGGQTALHEAAFWGRYKIAKMLIDAGADVNALSEAKISPLHDAARMSNVRIARLLLEHGARIDCQDKSGQTPLDWCRELRGKNANEIEGLFQEYQGETHD